VSNESASPRRIRAGAPFTRPMKFLLRQPSILFGRGGNAAIQAQQHIETLSTAIFEKQRRISKILDRTRTMEEA